MGVCGGCVCWQHACTSPGLWCGVGGVPGLPLLLLPATLAPGLGPACGCSLVGELNFVVALGWLAGCPWPGAVGRLGCRFLVGLGTCCFMARLAGVAGIGWLAWQVPWFPVLLITPLGRCWLFWLEGAMDGCRVCCGGSFSVVVLLMIWLVGWRW